MFNQNLLEILVTSHIQGFHFFNFLFVAMHSEKKRKKKKCYGWLLAPFVKDHLHNFLVSEFPSLAPLLEVHKNYCI